jgi:acylphosphatase
MANEEPSSAGDMVKAFTKAGDGTNLWTETKKTFSMGDGKSKKGDVLVGDIPGALAGLKAMVEEAKQAAAKKGGKKLTMWDFRASPHAAFGRTLDDTFTPFLMWARLGKDGKEDDDDDTSGQINVSKAFRRLESYAEWMEDTGTELTEPKLECDQGMLDVIKKFGMSTSLANAGTNPGLLLWWIDMGGIDKAEIAALPVSDVFRAFVWYSHAIMYDAKAQENGIGLVENLASMGFWTAITLIPAKVSAKLDRLTIGVLVRWGEYVTESEEGRASVDRGRAKKKKCTEPRRRGARARLTKATRDVRDFFNAPDSCHKTQMQLTGRIAATALVASLTQPMPPSTHALAMGGFEQQQYNRGGARLALLIAGGDSSTAVVADLCKNSAKLCTGVVYELSDDRLEVVAEGEKTTLENLLDAIQSKAGAGAELKANWQLPVGSYKSTFPVVDMTPETSSAEIALNVRNGKEGTLDYISRHVQIEAVFNRGLNVLKKERTSPTQLRLQVKGSSLRVKSFVRWCYNGPWMARADEVTIDWL